LEQLQAGRGVGVVLSPRALSLANAQTRSAQYSGLGADILVDNQFYVPDFSNRYTETYPTEEFRRSLSSLRRITPAETDDLAASIAKINEQVGAAAIIAPAVCYEAGRPETCEVNASLFAAARQAGERLGLPVYGTVILGNSATGSWDTVAAVLDEATALSADGWYFGFEFMQERIPHGLEATLRCCMGGLKLACTGQPVLHAFAGPMCLLSFCFGATGSAIGHSQNLWQFSRTRWQQSERSGGGGNAPARFFSSKLWGTIVYPDEIARLDVTTANLVLTKTEFTRQLTARPPFPALSRWESNKHLVAILCDTAAAISKADRALSACAAVDKILGESVAIHGRIEAQGVELTDNTSSYQESWRQSLLRLQEERRQDYKVLGLQGL